MDAGGHRGWRNIVGGTLEMMRWRRLPSKTAYSKYRRRSREAGPRHAGHLLRRHRVAQFGRHSLGGACQITAGTYPRSAATVDEPHAAGGSEAPGRRRRREGSSVTQLVGQLGRHLAQIQVVYRTGRGNYSWE